MLGQGPHDGRLRPPKGTDGLCGFAVRGDSATVRQFPPQRAMYVWGHMAGVLDYSSVSRGLRGPRPLSLRYLGGGRQYDQMRHLHMAYTTSFGTIAHVELAETNKPKNLTGDTARRGNFESVFI